MLLLVPRVPLRRAGHLPTLRDPIARFVVRPWPLALCLVGACAPPPLAVPLTPPPSAAPPLTPPLAVTASAPPSALAPPPDAGPPLLPCHDAPVADGGASHRPFASIWTTTNPQQWRTALVGYRSRVRLQDQRPIGAAGHAFAYWLTTVHNRIHPFWTGSYLDSLDALPCDDPHNSKGLSTKVEVIVAGDTGKIVSLGIVASSGLTDFDMAALATFDRGSPYGVAPEAIRSSDGNVYLQWVLSRDGVYGCSTINVHPFLLALPAAP